MAPFAPIERNRKRPSGQQTRIATCEEKRCESVHPKTPSAVWPAQPQQRMSRLIRTPGDQDPNPESSMWHAVNSSGGGLGPVVDGFGLWSWMFPPAK